MSMLTLLEVQYEHVHVCVKEKNRSVKVECSPRLQNQAAANESQMFILLPDPDR